jgi:hypothetical protein
MNSSCLLDRLKQVSNCLRFLTRYGLVQILFSTCFASICGIAAPLPEGWWRKSPEEVLKAAESSTFNVPYLRGSKPKLMNDSGSGFEYFQRRLSNGKIEIKRISQVNGRVSSTFYDLAEGKYIDSDGLLIKLDYEEGRELERRISETISNPYEYLLLEETLVGTNDCIVLRRSMSKEMLSALADQFYNKKPEQEKATLASKYIRAVKDFYIRKADGIIIGDIQRDARANRILEDNLLSAVLISVPISDEEFSLPKRNFKAESKSFDATVSLLTDHMEPAEGNVKNSGTQRIVTIVILALVGLVPIFIAVKSTLSKTRSAA